VFFQAEDGIRYFHVTGVQTCALPISWIKHLLPVAGWMALIIGLVIVYIYDKWQKNDPVQRIFPVIIWGRKLMVKLGPLFRQYLRSEERRVGKEGRSWSSPRHRDEPEA